MDGVALDIARELELKPARYSYRRSELKLSSLNKKFLIPSFRSVFISAGRYEMQTNLFADQVPTRIVIGLVESEAFNGDAGKSPFIFKHYNVSQIHVMTGGQTVPNVLYTLDYANGQFMRAYHDSQEGMGVANSMESNGISPHHFKNGDITKQRTVSNNMTF